MERGGRARARARSSYVGSVIDSVLSGRLHAKNTREKKNNPGIHLRARARILTLSTSFILVVVVVVVACDTTD